MANSLNQKLKQKDILITKNKPKKKVLLVEDVPLIQIIHKRILETLQCEIDIAINGQQALEMFNEKYDLIFMDIGLPDKNGIEVTHYIRRQSTDIPIVGLTAFKVDEIIEECIEAGMNDVLIKPTSLEQLESILNRYIH